VIPVDETFIDRSDNSTDPTNPKLVQLMQYGISNYNSGDMPSSDIDSEATDNTRQNIVFQPFTTPSSQSQNDPVTDIIFWNSTMLPPKKGIGNLPYGMPKLYPFGRGGFDEYRQVRLRPDLYGKRCLDLHGNDFGRHWGYLSIIFDAIALSKAFVSQYISMRVNPKVIKQGLWDKNEINECIDYTNKCEQARQQGMVVRVMSFV